MQIEPGTKCLVFKNYHNLSEKIYETPTWNLVNLSKRFTRIYCIKKFVFLVFFD